MSTLDKAISELGTAAGDITSSTNTAKSSIKAIKQAFKDIEGIGKSIGSALNDGSNATSKWASLITSTSTALTHISGNSSKTGMAISIFVKGVELATTAYMKQADALNNAYDGLADIGATANLTTVDLKKIGQSAGRYIENTNKMVQSIVSIGPALINLGPNTATAAKRLGKIFSTQETQREFLQLGIDPDRLLQIQSEAIKYLSGYGAPLDADDLKIKKATLEYTKTLNTLSSLTGETRDETAKKLADLKLDVSYQIQKTQMTRAGNTQAVAEMDKSLVLLKSVGADVAKGFSDFLANGQATTEEAKAMMSITRNQAARIAEDIKTKRISGIEGTKQLLSYYKVYMDNQKKNLSLSDEYAKQMGISGTVYARTTQILETKSEKEIQDMLDKQRKLKDEAKDSQDEQLKAERELGIIKNELTNLLGGVATTVLNTMLTFVKSAAYGAASLGHWLSKGSLKEDFEEVMIMLADKGQLTERRKEIEKDLKQSLSDIEKFENKNKSLKEAKEEVKKYQTQMNSKKSKTPFEYKMIGKNLEAAKQRLKDEEEYQERTKNLSYSELLLRRNKILERRQLVDTNLEGKTAVEQDEIRKQQYKKRMEMVDKTMNVDISDSEKYIQFNGQSGSMENWNALSKKNMMLTQQFKLLSQEYFSVKKEKVQLASAYRSSEEQQALYDGWVKGGGGKNNPTVNVPGHGNVSTPANPRNGETLGPHSKGIALDVNVAQLDFMEKSGMLEKFGFKRPYKDKDPVHIEQYRQGGLVNGSNMIEMHGREALIEMRNGSIPIDISSLTQGMKSQPEPQIVTTNTDENKIDLDLLSLIDSQFDDLITSIEKSNIIQYDIKTYMAA
jgi:hypothetical protein